MTDESRAHFHAVARFAEEDRPDEEVLTRIPSDGKDQTCAICSSAPVSWIHPLARSRYRFRVFDKGHTLPSWWWLCSECEAVYTEGDDVELVRRTALGWQETLPPAASYPGGVRPFTEQEYYHQTYEQPIEVFRRADMGAHRVR